MMCRAAILYRFDPARVGSVSPRAGLERNVMTEAKDNCSRCDGCGQVANDKDESPWTQWDALPEESKGPIKAGLIFPKPCPVCEGTGVAP